MLSTPIDSSSTIITTWANKCRPGVDLLKLTLVSREQTQSDLESLSSPEPSPYPPSSPSPSSDGDYSASSDTSDLDADDPGSTPTTDRATVCLPTLSDLRATLARCPEPRLRALVTRLVDHSPGVQHALAQELFLVAARSNSALKRVRKRRPRGATITPANIRAPPGIDSEEEEEGERPPQLLRPRPRSVALRADFYHPGQLKEDSFEFPWWCSSRPLTPRMEMTSGSCSEKEQEDQREYDHNSVLPCASIVRTIRMWNCCDGDAESPGCCSRAAAT